MVDPASPSDKGAGGGGLGHPHPEIKASVWSKNKGGPPLDPPLYFYFSNNISWKSRLY